MRDTKLHKVERYVALLFICSCSHCVADRPFLDLQRTSSDMKVDAGMDVDLVCNASAKPAATVEWTRLGGALLPIGQEKLLVSVLCGHLINFTFPTADSF